MVKFQLNVNIDTESIALQRIIETLTAITNEGERGERATALFEALVVKATEATTYVNKIGAMEEEVAKLREHNIQLEEDMIALQESVESANTLQRNLRKDNLALTQDLEEVEEMLRTVKASNNVSKKELYNKENTINELEDRIDELEETLKQSKEDVTREEQIKVKEPTEEPLTEKQEPDVIEQTGNEVDAGVVDSLTKIIGVQAQALTGITENSQKMIEAMSTEFLSTMDKVVKSVTQTSGRVMYYLEDSKELSATEHSTKKEVEEMKYEEPLDDSDDFEIPMDDGDDFEIPENNGPSIEEIIAVQNSLGGN